MRAGDHEDGGGDHEDGGGDEDDGHDVVDGDGRDGDDDDEGDGVDDDDSRGGGAFKEEMLSNTKQEDNFLEEQEEVRLTRIKSENLKKHFTVFFACEININITKVNVDEDIEDNNNKKEEKEGFTTTDNTPRPPTGFFTLDSQNKSLNFVLQVSSQWSP